MKICEYCKKEFEPNRNSHKYCCVECRNAAAKERYDLYYDVVKERKKARLFVCKVCGNEFHPVTGQQKYCGKECAGKAALERQKVWRSSTYSKAAEKAKPKLRESGAKSPALRRWESMSLQERAKECSRHHISYGKAQVMADNDMLPMDWGLC